jgi:polycystin 1L2
MRQTIPNCLDDYSLSNEDHQRWFPGWKLTNDNNSYSQSIQNAFIYVESDGIYDAGGYVYEFRGRLDEMKGNLTELRELSWIDSHTRAIIIEMTLFNPNVELFTSIRFVTEFFSTGGVFVQSHFDPIDLHNQFQGLSSLIHIICGIVYMAFICYFTLIEIQSFIKLKKKYFHSIWSFIQWGIIICSWIGVGIYIWRFKEGSRLNELFRETNGYKYINIQMGVDFDKILMFLFGFSCFFSTIKYLYLFRFNSRLSQFGKTLQYVQKDLFWFGWIFIIVLISFICLFYLLFVSKISSCSDVFHTIEMLFQMLLFRFNSKDLYEADEFLGPFIFALFIYFVVFIGCTMFISIINHGFRRIRRESKLITQQDQNVLLFLFRKIKRALGMYEFVQLSEI